MLQAGPCVVVQRRSKTTDGYEAVQLGLGLAEDSTCNNSVRLGRGVG